MEESKEEKKKGFNHKFFLGFFFLLLLGTIAYSAFFEDVKISGNAFKEKNETYEGLNINANLSFKNINVEDSFEKVVLNSNSDSFIYVGDSKININESSEIILEEYKGKIILESSSISFLKGNTNKIIINNQEINPRKKNTLDIELENNLSFDSLSLIKGIYLRKLNYITSGEISLNSKNNFELLEEEILMKDFYGNLTVENETFYFSGLVDSLDIKGNSNIEISY